MKIKLFILFLFFSFYSFSQILTKERIIYEYKDQLVMNDGISYKILTNKPFYEVSDLSIPQHKTIKDHVLRLNRVLVLRSDLKYAQLIEWIKDNMRYYEFMPLDNYNNTTNISENH